MLRLNLVVFGCRTQQRIILFANVIQVDMQRRYLHIACHATKATNGAAAY